MAFDLPEDPDWGKEYFGGIFIVFNDAVRKADVEDSIKSAMEPFGGNKVCFLSFSRLQDGSFQDLDLEKEIEDKSPEDLKNYFYHSVESTLFSEALGADRHAEALSKAKYKFAFVIMKHGSNKAKAANDVKRKVIQIRRTIVIG